MTAAVLLVTPSRRGKPWSTDGGGDMPARRQWAIAYYLSVRALKQARRICGFDAT